MLIVLPETGERFGLCEADDPGSLRLFTTLRAGIEAARFVSGSNHIVFEP